MFEPEYIRLSEAAKTFCCSEDSLIAAGLEGQLRVYFLLGEDRQAVRLRANPDGTIVKLSEEPQRKHFIYIPVSRRDLASALNGEVGTDVPAFTRPDKDGAYWAPCWERGDDGKVIPMPVVTRTGLFVRRSDFNRQENHEGSKAETPGARRARLHARANELKSSGVKAWLRQLAEEEGVTSSRLKQLLDDRQKSNDPTSLVGQLKASTKR